MKLVWILAPVGAAILMSPLVTKPIVMKQIDSAAIEVDRNVNGLGLTMEQRTQDSGFLSSSIVTRIQSIEAIGQQNQEICLDIKTDVSHSFLDILQGNMASATTTLLPMSVQDENCNIRQIFEDNDLLSDFYAKNYGDKSPIIVGSAYGILGSTQGSFELLPFKIDIPKNDQGKGSATIESTKIIGNVSASSSLDSYTFDMEWKGFSALIENDSGPIKARVKGMTVKGDQYLAYENIWLGEINQKLTDISVSHMAGAEVTKYSLPEIDISSEAFEDKNGIQSRTKIQINDINENLGDFGMDLSMSNLDPEALSSISTILDDLINNNGFQNTSLNGQEETLISLGQTLLKKAQFDINSIKYELDNQAVEFTGMLKAQEVGLVTLDQIKQNPMQLIEMINFKLKGTVDKGFSEALSGPAAKVMTSSSAESDVEIESAKADFQMMLDGQLANAVGMGFAVENGEKYESEIIFEKGVATINGHPMQLPIPTP